MSSNTPIDPNAPPLSTSPTNGHSSVIVDALLLGGGLGKRFNATDSGSLPKQFRMLGDAPVFIHSLRGIFSLGCVRQVVFVVPKSYIAFAQDLISQYFGKKPPAPVVVVEGGDQRQDSSRIGLEILEGSGSVPSRVLIHDACRPFLPGDFRDRIKASLFDRSYGAWVPVVPVVDTLKRIENHQVVETVDRSTVQRVQTPQIFEYSVVRSLIEKTKDLSDLNFTDDASLCEYYGIPVGAFDGDVRNIKLTYDFELRTLGTMITDIKEGACDLESATISTV